MVQRRLQRDHRAGTTRSGRRPGIEPPHAGDMATRSQQRAAARQRWVAYVAEVAGGGFAHHGAIPVTRAWHPAQATSIGVIRLTVNSTGPVAAGRSSHRSGPRPRTSARRWGGCWMSLHRRRGLPGGAVHSIRSRCSATTGTGITRPRRVQLKASHIVAPGPVSAPATSRLGADRPGVLRMSAASCPTCVPAPSANT